MPTRLISYHGKLWDFVIRTPPPPTLWDIKSRGRVTPTPRWRVIRRRMISGYALRVTTPWFVLAVDGDR